VAPAIEEGGDAVLEEIDERRVPPCATSAAQRVVFRMGSLPCFRRLRHGPTFSTIDVMVVYTPAARAGQAARRR